MRVLAMILAGGANPALSVLTAERSEASIPFGGKYRLIDFSLSNCVNSDIFNVGILTQYKPRSLNDHIRVGKAWDLDRAVGGVTLLQPYISAPGETGAWQRGTADALRFNLDFVAEQRVDTVLILAGDHIYKMDYRPLLHFHEQRDADCTIAVRTVSPHDTHRFGMVAAGGNGRVLRFEEKPRRTQSRLASMGIYAFKARALVDWLTGAGIAAADFGRDLLPAMLANGRSIFSYGFDGYWVDAGTVQAYWEANMALLAESPALDLYDPAWVIHTRSQQLPPAYVGDQAQADGSLLCDGCQVFGRVVRSIIGPGALVEADAEVSDSIIMNGTMVSQGAVVDRAILDKRVVVEQGACVGWGEDNTPNRVLPNNLNTGITLVGKRARIPANIRIGRNAVIRPGAAASEFPGPEVKSGETI